MKNLTQRWQGWPAIFLITLIIGIGLRGVNLDEKVYWHDEVYSSWRIMGYTNLM